MLKPCPVCLSQGVNHEGEIGGVCSRHSRRRCGLCPALSYGAEFCPSCAADVGEARRRGRVSNPHILDPERAADLSRLDGGDLRRAKFYMLDAVESFFIALQKIADAFGAAGAGGGAGRKAA